MDPLLNDDQISVLSEQLEEMVDPDHEGRYFCNIIRMNLGIQTTYCFMPRSMRVPGFS